MASHKNIEDQAAAWLAERDSGEWTEAREQALRCWLESSTAHRVAYLRLEAAWEQAQRLKALGAGYPRGVVPPPGAWREGPFFTGRELAGDDSVRVLTSAPESHSRSDARIPWAHLYVAAGVLLAVGLTALGTYWVRGARGGEYSTPVGEVASVPLKDGSSITLNTATAVHVDLTPRERRVDLAHGEAFFVVAKDLNRPFVVRAGSKRVVAVGTQFSVRRDGDDVRVVVTEGTVRLESIGRPMHVKGEGTQGDAGSGSPESARLPAGTIARATESDVLVEERSIPEAEEALTWRLGYLTFHETTLAEAVEEFNRYNEHRITIEDPKLAAIRISGTFRPTNNEAFVRLLQEGYGIRSENTYGEITLKSQ